MLGVKSIAVATLTENLQVCKNLGADFTIHYGLLKYATIVGVSEERFVE